jgi:hypothetical protein
MLLFYIDEFGDGEMGFTRSSDGRRVLKLGASEWFILSAVGIKETSRPDLAKSIQHFKDIYFPGWPLLSWKDTEIKGRHLKQAATRLSSGRIVLRPDGWRTLTSHQFVRLVADLERLWRKFRPMVYVVAIDKSRVLNQRSPRPDPVGAAYTFLQQRLALMHGQVFGGTEGVLLIADEQTSHEKFFRQGHLTTLRTRLTAGLPMQPDFNLILDKPVWIDPKLNEYDREILQLPDIVAFASAQAVLHGKVPAEPSLLWRHIAPCLMSHWRNGTPVGGGFFIWPRPVGGYPTGL